MSKLYAGEMHFKLCITCWQMIGNPEAVIYESLLLWLGDTGDWRGGSQEDGYAEYLIDYVRDAV